MWTEQVVETKKLHELAKGSFENCMQLLNTAIAEDSVIWGGNSHLFATHPDRVVVYVEDRGFFSCGYRLDENGVKFIGKPEREDVHVMNEDALVSRGIESMYGGGSVSFALKALASIPGDKPRTEQAAKEKMSKLVSGSIWRGYMFGDGAEHVRKYADEVYLREVSSDLYDHFGELSGSELVAAIADLSQRLSKLNAFTLESVSKYHEKTGGMRSDEEDQVLTAFDSVVGDFLENIDVAIDELSIALKEARKGNDGYAGVVHSAVVEEYDNFHLGHRFIRKMTGELMAI